MSSHVNISAYEGVEELGNFTSKEFEVYCQDKLNSCNKHLHFIKRVLKEKKELNVCEIGSGNSKLLYALEQHGYLKNGLGIEVSQSRFQFAQKFKDLVKSKRVSNVNQNIFDYQFSEKYDLVIGVDVVLQLITPIHTNAEDELFNLIDNILNKDGYIIFELWSLSNILNQLSLNNNRLKIWDEFPESDPYKYILSEVFLDQEDNIHWDKKFIKRDSHEESTFTNILKPYSKEGIKKLLERYNFKEIEVFDFWEHKNDCEEDEYIVVAKK